MSTGIDFGNQNCVVAVAKKGGIETESNEASSRLTPCLVGFGTKQRFIGESALTQQVMNVKNTVGDVKRFLGRKFKEPEIQEEIKRNTVPVVETADGGVGFQIWYNGEQAVMTPVQIVAMLLSKLAQTGLKEFEPKRTDIVVSVPGYFTQAQRLAMQNAAEVAGLNCLKLINETTATALAYGFYKLELPENDPQRVLFIDCGQSATSVAVVDFTKNKMKVVGTAYDRNLGGRDVDELLAQHFAKLIKEKYKLDVLGNARAALRLRLACEKLKKVMSSGVPEGPLNIENIMEDKDVSSTLTKKDFDELLEPFLKRQVNLVKQVLEETSTTPEQLYSVEIVGGTKRIPLVQKAISEYLKKEVKQTLSDSECVAKGCALQCAMLSPVFKVREYSISDFNTYPIKVSWSSIGADDMQVDSDANSKTMFPRGPLTNTIKMLTLKQTSPFELNCSYEPSPLLPPDTPLSLAKFILPSLPPQLNPAEKPQVKIKIKLNNHGILTIDSAEQVETIEVEVPPEPVKTEGTPADASQPAATATPEAEPASPASQTPQDGSQSAQSAEGDKAAQGAQPAQPQKKKKTKHTDIHVEQKALGLTRQELNELVEQESKLQAQDRLAVETADAKNAVESYVLDMRPKVNDELYEWATREDREAFVNLANDVENWLYDEGDDTTKGVYVEKLNELKKFGEPILERRRESAARERNYAELAAAIAGYRSTINDFKYEHIEAEEKKKVLDECNKVEKTILDKLSKQNSLPKSAPPSMKASEITQSHKELDKFCKPILSKPKPTPPPPTPAEPEKKPEDAKSTEAKADKTNTNQETKSQSESTQDVPMTDAEASS